MAGALSLRPYQREALTHILSHHRCALWAPMGAGKTAIVLHALATWRELGPALVLAPKRVAAYTWPAEVEKWKQLGLSCVYIGGTPAQRARAMSQKADIYTAGYETVEWLSLACGGSWRWPIVVADESTRLKSFRLRHGGRRAAALARVAWNGVHRLVELTGTPVPNGLIDLWGQAWFLDTGHRLGKTFSSFTARWFRPAPNGFGLVPTKAAPAQIKNALSDICMTVNVPFSHEKAVVVDVPVVLPPDVRATYDTLERQAWIDLKAAGASVTAVNAAVLTNKLRQVATGTLYGETERHHVHDAKLDALASIVEEAAGASVLVAYDFTEDAARIKKRFPFARDIREKGAIDLWNAGQIRMLLLHPASAGHGLNLQYGGNIIVWMTLPWSLELYEQANERIGPLRQRQAGFDRPVFVYRLMAEDTIDQVVAERLAGKGSVQQLILDSLRRKYDATSTSS